MTRRLGFLDFENDAAQIHTSHAAQVIGTMSTVEMLATAKDMQRALELAPEVVADALAHGASAGPATGP